MKLAILKALKERENRTNFVFMTTDITSDWVKDVVNNHTVNW